MLAQPHLQPDSEFPKLQTQPFTSISISISILDFIPDSIPDSIKAFQQTGTPEHHTAPSHPPTTLRQSQKQPTTMIQVHTAPLPCCDTNNALCTPNRLLPQPQAAYSGCNPLPSSTPAERPQQHYLTVFCDCFGPFSGVYPWQSSSYTYPGTGAAPESTVQVACCNLQCLWSPIMFEIYHRLNLLSMYNLSIVSLG